MNDFFSFDDINETPKAVEPVITTTVEPTDITPKPAVQEKEETFSFDDTTSSKEPDSVPQVVSILDIFTELSKDESVGLSEDILPKTTDADSIKDVLVKYGENKITSFLKEAVEQNPLIGNVLSYVKDGGNVEAIAEHFYKNPLVSTLPFVTPEDKKAFLFTAYTKFEDKSVEEAEILVKAIEDNGKIDSIAENIRTKLLNKEVKDIEEFSNKAKNDRVSIESSRKVAAQELSKIVETSKDDEFKGINIKTIPNLVNYMTDYKFKDSNNNEYTQLDVDLNNALKDSKKRLLLGALLKTDFNFSSVLLKAKEELVTAVNPHSKVVVPVVTGTKTTKETADEFYSFIEANTKK